MSVKRTSVAGRSHRLDQREAVRTTRTGIKIVLRPVRSKDKALLRFFAASLSEEDLYFRFFRHIDPTEALLTKLVDIDPTVQIAILALVGSGETEKIVGVGRCFIDRKRATAELVLAVGNEYQNKGIGRELLLHLISLTRAQGLKGLTAQVLVDNAAILRLLRSLDGIEYDIQRRVEEGVFYLDMVFR